MTVARDETAILRWWLEFRFAERLWAERPHALDPFLQALAHTETFAHLPLCSVAGKRSKAKGALGELRAAWAVPKARYALLAGGKTIHDDATTSFIELEITPRLASLTTAVAAPALPLLGAAALDDFFVIARALQDALHPAAHLTRGDAKVDFATATPEARLVSDWPLRRIAAILNPAQPPREDGDDWLLASSKALAEATPPTFVRRAAHGPLVELRWIDDPKDTALADQRSLAHESWVRTLVKNEPML